MFESLARFSACRLLPTSPLGAHHGFRFRKVNDVAALAEAWFHSSGEAHNDKLRSTGER